MKIQYINGDLFKTQHPVIMHGCNDQGVMGSGVAKTVRDLYPKAYEKYNKYCENTNDVGGDVVYVQVKPNLVIANAITQHNYGRDGRRFVNYEWVAQCIKNADQLAEFRGIEHIAMPKIGSQLGGGDWNVIAAIIESESKHFTPVVYIYEG